MDLNQKQDNIKAAYIHIPFCKTICSYCDFCKFYYEKKWIKPYLSSLKKEIESTYQNESLKTLYIGGGTPNSLSNDELKELLEIVSIFKLEEDYEYTIECNVELITMDNLALFKEYGVNRLSIGVQTFNNDLLKEINRNHTKEEVINKISLIKQMGFSNINIDLMYGLPNQTVENVIEDIEIFLSLDIPHISTYSLILENHTVFGINNIKPIDEDIEVNMYNTIKDILVKNNYNYYEISNYAKDGYESIHNLTYWNNDEYYGFGIGASSYINNKRINNITKLNNYLQKDYRYNDEIIDNNSRLEYEFILGFRKTKGINKEIFKKKYHRNLEDIKKIKELIDEGKLINDIDNIYIKEDLLYIENDILVRFIGENYEE